jgi:hypothetical protein
LADEVSNLSLGLIVVGLVVGITALSALVWWLSSDTIRCNMKTATFATTGKSDDADRESSAHSQEHLSVGEASNSTDAAVLV